MEQQEPITKDHASSVTRITCPTCKRTLSVPTQGLSGRPKFFPFCSERCRLVDLNAWLDADYRIAARPDEETEDALGGDGTTEF